MMRLIFPSLLALFSLASVSAQNQFYRLYQNVEAGNLFQTTDGYVLIGGHITSSSTDDDGPAIRFISNETEILKTRSYFGTTNRDRAGTGARANDGGYLLAGYTYSFALSPSDGFIVKVDSTGALEWSKIVGFKPATANERITSVTATQDGGFLLLGVAGATNNSSAFIAKIDGFGNLVWGKYYMQFTSSFNKWEPIGARELGNGDIVVATSGYDTYWWAHVMKMKSNGDVVWAKRSVEKYQVYSFDLAANEDMVVGGDNILFRLDTAGSVIWTKEYDGIDISIQTIKGLAGGEILIGGTLFPGGGACLAKTDSSGKMLWLNSTGGPTGNKTTSIIEQGSGYSFIGNSTLTYPTFHIGTNLNGEWGCENSTNMAFVLESSFSLTWTDTLNEGGEMYVNSVNPVTKDYTEKAGSVCEDYDVAMSTLFSPKEPACAGENQLDVGLYNFGDKTYSQIMLYWQINGGPVDSFSWSGTYSKLLYIVPSSNIQLVAGTNRIRIWHGKPDGNMDDYPFNDTLAYVIVAQAAPSVSITVSGDTAFCEGGSVTLTANAGTGITYQWKKNGQIISGATAKTYMATTSGSYTVDVENAGNCHATSRSVAVEVWPKPAKPTISQNGNTLTSSANDGNQWYKNGAKITGANSKTLEITESGTYKVEVTNQYGCVNESNNFNATYVGIEKVFDASSRISYNALLQTLIIEENKGSRFSNLQIMSASGQVLFSKKIMGGSERFEIDTGSWPTGFYLVRIYNGQKIHTLKWIKE